eukprot:CAMPEP_0206624514 /NCGR_PEP_ID=MMETSP0325_2-20121206/64175_1 /ASSEMBLY_ACC=CAM_ASM_000347 /TAXON_ID=2866 /ORGANISM="Crypthecodinium cohnii, Strain Seligo" /LENGTH=82 /DNA_ID=CAMNT_0054148501 /DNA_START=21 /DNA_END=266 /DNA_ORIENTATION=+
MMTAISWPRQQPPIQQNNHEDDSLDLESGLASSLPSTSTSSSFSSSPLPREADARSPDFSADAQTQEALFAAITWSAAVAPP